MAHYADVGQAAQPGGELVGWQRWRRQLLPQTRRMVLIRADDPDGIFHIAEYPLLPGVSLQMRHRTSAHARNVS